MKTTSSGAKAQDKRAARRGAELDVHYPKFMEAVQHVFNGVGAAPLFCTDAANLWESYLEGFPAGLVRQHYTCNACRHFITRYGGLVTIDPKNGETVSALWDHFRAPKPFGAMVGRLKTVVETAQVTGVFAEPGNVWGTPYSGGWHHLCVQCSGQSFKPRLPRQTAGQYRAEKKAEFGMLLRAVLDFPVETVRQAVALLEANALYRSEATLGVARWFYDLQCNIGCMCGEDDVPIRSPDQSEGARRLIWHAVATAPAGWAHVRSSMIGTLLEDIQARMPLDKVQRRFAEKMDPLQYRRPTAPPKAGNVEQAERLVAQLGIERSLERRFAQIEDVQLLWSDYATRFPRAAGHGVFDHLRNSDPNPGPYALPAQDITWVKFEREVLRKATRIDYPVPTRGPFLAMCTAVHHDAPPILQWDHPEDRNRVSWYVYPGGSLASQWGLRSGHLCRVTGVARLPFMWGPEASWPTQFAPGAVLFLEGAVDQGDSGSGLFPEILRSELHGVRSTIEAHSRRTPLQGRVKASACGVDLRDWGQVVRVWFGSEMRAYRIDRWD